MQAELAKIRAELDAKARVHKYGFKTRRSSERQANMNAYEESDEESDEESSSDEESDDNPNEEESGSEMEEEEEDEEEEEEEDEEEIKQVAKSKKKRAAPSSVLPRGVTVRPSGKWVRDEPITRKFLS